MSEENRIVIRAVFITLIAFVLSCMLAFPIRAETCHDLVMSYVMHDQDKPKEPGDILYTEYESGITPVLMHTTGYCEGTIGSHGDKMREGYCAASPEMYGSAAIIYEAIQQEDGTFQIGNYITTLEIKDTGYGYATNTGVSVVRPDKNISHAGAGTIESGIHIDCYFNTLSGCWKWMKKTKGFVFVEIVPAKG